MARRRELDGPLPIRVVSIRRPLKLPDDKLFSDYDEGSSGREVSTTMVFTQMLRNMMRDEEFGARVVPIVPDEPHLRHGLAVPGVQDLRLPRPAVRAGGPRSAVVLRRGQDGQLLEEGITEAGSLASWTAAATSYATVGVPMVPFYSFYSMFGFQRVGDLIWSAADSRARAF